MAHFFKKIHPKLPVLLIFSYLNMNKKVKPARSLFLKMITSPLTHSCKSFMLENTHLGNKSDCS